ncbi:hypothetical protein CEXT_565761 [Caerostris extrusa]|uniref:Uncharacterized protein n=1 Tax=Caerostris extrusa TaxID=172846 RepID=A0AAV4QBD6_CAEEX|nr:hypothetical protein CEXT_565761 [Caerostris extrusa]
MQYDLGMQRKRRTPFLYALGDLREFLEGGLAVIFYGDFTKRSFRKRTYFYSFRDQRKRSKVKLCHTNSFETYAMYSVLYFRFDVLEFRLCKAAIEDE